MPSRLTIGLQAIAIFATSVPLVVGCGTTRSSDTNRTATEQLLISDAIDRAVQTINLKPLAGQSVYLDDSRLGDVVDRNYLVSTLRQHLLASGCALRADRDQADYVVETRAGAIGTDRNDLLFGVPSMNVPQIFPVQPVAAAIPEVPIAKRRDQRGIAKIAVFAYHRETGTPVWQSGVAHQESSSNDVWILGAGPFQQGTIYEGTEFAGTTFGGDDADDGEALRPNSQKSLAQERIFTTPQQIAQRSRQSQNLDAGLVQAAHEEPDSGVTQSKLAADEGQTPVEVQQAAASGSTTVPSKTASPPAPADSPIPEARQLIAPAPSSNQATAVLSASVYGPEIAHRSSSVHADILMPGAADPVPLPKPRLSPPR